MYSFSYLEPVHCSMSSSNCCFLTCIQVSQEAGQLVWYSHLFQNFPQFVVIHTVKGFSIANEANVFLKLSCFYYDSMDVGNLISSSSAFSKFSLNIWKFSVHVLLKHHLKNFEHYFASMWHECSCAVVWAFSLWRWNENWPFPVLATAEFSRFAGILSAAPAQHHLLGFETAQLEFWSPPLDLFVVMLPKAHLTSHSRMSGSRWVITQSWLSQSWRSFLYSSNE